MGNSQSVLWTTVTRHIRSSASLIHEPSPRRARRGSPRRCRPPGEPFRPAWVSHTLSLPIRTGKRFLLPRLHSLSEHYWSGCSNVSNLILTVWGHKIPARQLSRDWALDFRLDVLASMYTLYAGLARARREHRLCQVSFQAAAIA